MYKTLGGDRLGSGNKMKVELHNYERSTHDLGNVWRSTMAPGTLVPFYKKLALNGDTWTINLQQLVKTMPAIGPLFGTYKLQMDFFTCPIRLYNGVLHNNWTKIGLDMSKVKLPKIELTTDVNTNTDIFGGADEEQISPSSLLHYLGIKGIGGVTNGAGKRETISRKFNAVPILAYYDIFKNYYANKQEEYAYVLANDINVINTGSITKVDTYRLIAGNASQASSNGGGTYVSYPDKIIAGTPLATAASGCNWITRMDIDDQSYLHWAFIAQIYFEYDNSIDTQTFKLISFNPANNTFTSSDLNDTTKYRIIWDRTNKNAQIYGINGWQDFTAGKFYGIAYNALAQVQSIPQLLPFKLEYIDDMRQNILRDTGLNHEYVINTANLYPYRVIHDTITNPSSNYSYCASKFDMAGLVVKTYQSDMYNSWMSKAWINQIKGLTAVDTSSGSFTIDALTLAKKVYNMLNRIAVSGGTYQDWQEAVYGEDVSRMAESPIYCGGGSALIGFEEVVSTADTNTDTAGDQPLGTLGGKGKLLNEKGGQIEIHIKEPSYIMGIASITPIIDYFQGNDFDMTELDSINDLHKPELDQIGFEDLMLERMAWWAKTYDFGTLTWNNNAVAKLPSWINYMTSVNEVHGQFAEKSKLGWMVLTRDYEKGTSLLNGTSQVIPIKDFTTYINPSKFNYQFADTRLNAQNFWVQIGINAIARRKMSAKIMPNL